MEDPPHSSLASPSPFTIAAMASITSFIAKYTVIDHEVSLLEECPICLDDYTGDVCLRISGIEGCSHRIGLRCLREMLGRHPNQEKKCPLCRTIWIAAPTRSETRQEFIHEVAVPRLSEHRPGHQNATIPRRDISLHHQNQAEAAPQRTTPSIAAASAAAMREYREQVLTFEEFRRDIENVRRRARETSMMGSRRSPREPQASNHHTTALRPYVRAAAARDTSNNRVGSMDPPIEESASFLNSPESRGNTYIHREDIIRRLTIARTRFGIETPPPTAPPTAPATRELRNREVAVTRVTVRIPASDATDTTEAERPATAEARQHRNQTTSHPEPEPDLQQQRETALAAREAAQTQRERDLDAREAALNRREADLRLHESTARDQLRIAGRITTLRRAQHVEIQQLLAQQQELLDNLVRDGGA